MKLHFYSQAEKHMTFIEGNNPWNVSVSSPYLTSGRGWRSHTRWPTKPPGWSCRPQQITSCRAPAWGGACKKRNHQVHPVCSEKKTKEAVNGMKCSPREREWIPDPLPLAITRNKEFLRGWSNPTRYQQPHVTVSRNCRRMLLCSPPHWWHTFMSHLSPPASFTSTTLLPLCHHFATHFPSVDVGTGTSHQCHQHLI